MSQKKLVRAKFRDSVFKRDNYTCVFCDIKEDLDAHHITDRNLMPNGGYVKENGISLCHKHHMDAEVFHNSNGLKCIEGMSPEELYIKIKSSYEEAVKVSERLK